MNTKCLVFLRSGSLGAVRWDIRGCRIVQYCTCAGHAAYIAGDVSVDIVVHVVVKLGGRRLPVGVKTPLWVWSELAFTNFRASLAVGTGVNLISGKYYGFARATMAG
jgi:hypothetical protein